MTTRYHMIYVERIEEAGDGDWVKYEDHQAAINAINAVVDKEGNLVASAIDKLRIAHSEEIRQRNAVIDDLRAKIERHIRNLNRLLTRAVDCMPGAADCPRPNANVCEYTDKEWAEIVAFTKQATDYLKKALT